MSDPSTTGVEMDDMSKIEANNDMQMLSEPGTVSSSGHQSVSADKNNIVVPKQYFYMLLVVLVGLVSVTTYLGVSLNNAYNQNNTENDVVNPCGLTSTEMVVLWNTHTYSEFVTRDVSETMTTFGPNLYLQHPYTSRWQFDTNLRCFLSGRLYYDESSRYCICSYQ